VNPIAEAIEIFRSFQTPNILLNLIQLIAIKIGV